MASQHKSVKAGRGRSTVRRSFAVLVAGALAVTSLAVGAGPAAAAGAGTADAAFNATVGTGLNSYVQAIAQQSDGKLLVGGSFFEYNGQPRSALVRLNVDGSLDSTFVQTGAGVTGVVYAIAVQPDGKIVVGGSFDLYNGIARKKVLRLEANGALDLTFAQTGTGLDGAVNDLALVPGGKILVSGYFTHYGVTPRSRIAQLTSTGALDGTFDPGSGFDQDVYTISRAASGDIWAGGPFTTYRGLPVSHVVRIPANGAAAYPAPSSAGLGAVYDIQQTPTGQVLVGGLNVLSRYSSAGALDPTFAPTPASLPSYVFTIGQQSDGRIVIGGRKGLT
ncbi:MAG: delta-60 repeat domain-containing protein, partial [Actinomycetes bacterium]